MKMKDTVFLEQVIKASDEEISNIIRNTFNSSELEVSNSYIYFKGSIPLLLQAHIDTVKIPTTPIDLEITNKIITNKLGILGTDDRAGVYALLEIYKKLVREGKALPSFLFTDGEESGGTGMEAFAIVNPDIYVNLIIAIDRQGVGEYVTYNHLPTEVRKYVESFGFRNERGVFSDCMILTEETQIPSVNVSAGYYHQHSSREKLHIDELYLTIYRILRMINNPIQELYKSKPTNYSYKNRYGTYGTSTGTEITMYNKDNDWGESRGHSTRTNQWGWEEEYDSTEEVEYAEDYAQCCICSEFHKISETIEVWDEDEKDFLTVCYECYDAFGDSFGWDDKTDTVYFDNSKS